jgi:hypothetical protein
MNSSFIRHTILSLKNLIKPTLKIDASYVVNKCNLLPVYFKLFMVNVNKNILPAILDMFFLLNLSNARLRTSEVRVFDQGRQPNKQSNLNYYGLITFYCRQKCFTIYTDNKPEYASRALNILLIMNIIKYVRSKYYGAINNS